MTTNYENRPGGFTRSEQRSQVVANTYSEMAETLLYVFNTELVAVVGDEGYAAFEWRDAEATFATVTDDFARVMLETLYAEIDRFDRLAEEHAAVL